MNMITSGIATLLLIFSSYFYKKLRDSRTVRRTCKNLLNLTSRNDSTTWGKSMEITDSGVPTATAWYKRSTSENSIRDRNTQGGPVQFQTHQFSTAPVHTAEQFRPSAPTVQMMSSPPPPPSTGTRAGYPLATYPGTSVKMNPKLDSLEEKEENSDPDSEQDIEQEMEQLHNKIRKFSMEKKARNTRKNIQ